jgi:hypothetical protein
MVPHMESRWKMRPDALKTPQVWLAAKRQSVQGSVIASIALGAIQVPVELGQVFSSRKRQSRWIALKHHKKWRWRNSEVFRSDRLDRRYGRGRRDVQMIANFFTTIVHSESGVCNRELRSDACSPLRREQTFA